MNASFSYEMNKAAKALFSGDFINDKTLGYIGGKILDATVGRQSTSVQHFNTGQGKWPRLADETIVDRRKKDKRIFVRDGKILKAISTAPNRGEVMGWGSSADIYVHSSHRKKKYVSGGMWATAQTGKTKLIVTTGFSGKMKHSADFNRMRRKLARESGARYKGKSLTVKEVRRLVSVKETHEALKKTGKRKYEAKGALGIKDGKMVMARDKDNLSYANIVQTGRFIGIETSKGLLITAGQIGNLTRKGKRGLLPGKGEYTRKFTQGKQRELLPYQDSDSSRMRDVISAAVSDIFRQMGGS